MIACKYINEPRFDRSGDNMREASYQRGLRWYNGALVGPGPNDMLLVADTAGKLHLRHVNQVMVFAEDVSVALKPHEER
jgi:ribosomal protein L27